MQSIALVHHNGDEEAYWDYLTKQIERHEEVLDRDEANATLEDLVLLCDRSAGNANAHDFCGTHRLLGSVLYQQVGRAQSTKAMLRIAKLGGLHGMSGVCSDEDAYQLLGVGESGSDWGGDYGE